MHDLLSQRLNGAFQRWIDLLDTLPEGALAQRLPVPSNSIGGQFWCLVGARESYARAIAVGSWKGFACSLSAEDALSRQALRAALQRSADAALAAVATLAADEPADTLADALADAPADDLADALQPGVAACLGFALDLLEHEAQHQGQLIRYVYGLGHSFPESWRVRWALS